jgi:hypothetical protein
MIWWGYGHIRKEKRMNTATLETERETHKFAYGDVVQWSSQAGGFSKTKTGMIIAVIPAGKVLDLNLVRKAFPNHKLTIERTYNDAGRRMHESYLVSVERPRPVPVTAARPAMPLLYWPRVKALQPVTPTASKITGTSPIVWRDHR